jgi:MFS family permease
LKAKPPDAAARSGAVEDPSSGRLSGDGRPVRAYGVVILLVCASALGFLDRAILSLLVDPIKSSLGLTDSHIGMLSGFAFALFYAILGLPLGRWADKHNRVALIVFGVATWSFATVLCGFSKGFYSLFAARVLVGVGEAALGPASLSLLSDMFPRRRLGFILALTATGITIGNGVAIELGGAIIHTARTMVVDLPWGGGLSGWRLVFVLAGVCGFPLAALMALIMREPARSDPLHAAPTLAEVGRQLAAHFGAYGGIMIGYSLMVVMSFAQLLWGPTYFMRVHHVTPEAFALFYGPLMGIGGTAGLLLGGAISDHLTRRGISAAPAKVILVSIIMQTPFLIAGYLLRSTTWALALYGAGVVTLAVNGGLQSATLQRFTPARMLGSISAIYLVFANIIGGGLGPVLVGATSHILSPDGSKLGVALALVGAITLPVAAVLVFLALRPVERAELKQAKWTWAN